MLVQVVFGVAIIDKSCTVHPNMKVNMNKMVKSTTKENRGTRHVASRAPGGPPAAPATTAAPAAPAPAPAVVAVVAAAAAPCRGVLWWLRRLLLRLLLRWLERLLLLLLPVFHVVWARSTRRSPP